MASAMINTGVPNEQTWSLMKNFIKSETAKPDDYFVFGGVAAGDKVVPNRYMQIMPDLLQVIADDANKGVSFMLNHNWSQIGIQSIPVGKVFYGEIQGATQEGEATSLYLAQYVRRSDTLCDGYSNNSIIEKIEDGVLEDTSIAFSTDIQNRKCSLCGNSYYSRECIHYAGQKYIVNEETNEVKQCIVQWYAPQNILATNTSLMENSIVFDGAYPNAKTQSSVNDDTISDSELYKSIDDVELKSLTQENQVIFLGGKDAKVLVKNLSKEVKSMADETKVVEVTEQAVIEPVVDPMVQTPEPIEPVVEPVAEPVAEPVTQMLTVEQEKYLALGQQIEKEAIEEAIQFGIKAKGNEFDKDGWESRLKALSVKDIKAFTEQWKKDADNSVNVGQVSQFVSSETAKFVQDMSWAKTSDY